MDWFNLEAKDILGIIADSLSIFGITVISITTGFYGIFKKNRDYVAMRVSMFLAYLFKSVIIFLLIAITSVITFTLIEMTSFIDRQPLILSIGFSSFFACFGIVFIWLLGSLIWTSSSRHIAGFLVAIGFKIERNAPKLEILSAWYGTDKRNIDVTGKLIDLIRNNRLKIKIENDLAGDPLPGAMKQLVISYRYDSKVKSTTLAEHQILELPEKELI